MAKSRIIMSIGSLFRPHYFTTQQKNPQGDGRKEMLNPTFHFG
jgi:hypothetical protein